jgi:hypothetical protein
MPALYSLTAPSGGGHYHFMTVCLLVAQVVFALYCVPSVVYCIFLLVGSLRRRKNPAQGLAAYPSTRFCIIIPAHNEQTVIEATLASVSRLSYPSELVRCIVVADNCTDRTESLARAWVSPVKTEVLQRLDAEHRGKGYALNFALDTIVEAGEIDAIVIVDADSQIDPQFLTQMDAAFSTCAEARSQFAAQGFYQVLNFSDNWRTALMAGALSLVHYVRPLARENLGGTVGLKGNGMCFGFALAQCVRWRSDSITEDIDYTLDALEHHDVRVCFVPSAIVRAEMPVSAAASQGQRRRWEQGRSIIVRERALPLLLSGLVKADRIRIDLAADLLCPPLAQLCAGVLLFLISGIIGAAIQEPGAPLCIGAAIACMAGILIYVLIGFKIAGAPKEAYSALGMALFYMPWKITTVLSSKSSGVWHKTKRLNDGAATTERDLETNGVFAPKAESYDHNVSTLAPGEDTHLTEHKFNKSGAKSK